jgi:hypothetical protein
VQADQLKYYLAELLRRYLSERQPQDRFVDFVYRHSKEEMENW